MGEKTKCGKKRLKIRGNEKNEIKKMKKNQKKIIPNKKITIILKFINSVTLLGEQHLGGYQAK